MKEVYYVPPMESKISLFILVVSILISVYFLMACSAPSYKLPCKIDGVTIEIKEHPQAAGFECKRRGSVSDFGNYKEDPAGCADYSTKTIITDNDDSHIIHEIRHFIKRFCK